MAKLMTRERSLAAEPAAQEFVAEPESRTGTRSVPVGSRSTAAELT